MTYIKLYIKNFWHVTEDVQKENLVIFRDDDKGQIKHFSIPLEDLEDWDIGDE